jgi:GH35 family endo-1,4-beta-xylanase
MSKKIRSILVLVILLVSACSPAGTSTPTVGPGGSNTQMVASSATPGSAGTKTLMPEPSATSGPSTTLKQDALLYSGPGNADFDTTASLNAGAMVTLLAIYGDFVQVMAMIDGQEKTGYIWKEALSSLPAGLPALTADQVPWDLLFLPQCSPGSYDSVLDTVTFSNTSNNYYDTESSPIPLAGSLKIEMTSTQVSGATNAAIKILGIPEPTSGDWWQGITRMDLGYTQGHYSIGIRDGRTEYEALTIDLALTTNQGIQIVFDQPEGKSFHILDGAGNEVQTVDLTAKPELSLPNGLFPNGVVHVGTTMPPQSSFTVKGLRIGVVPSGAWLEDQNGYYSDPGLAELAAQRNLTIGTDFNNDKTSDPRYCRIMKHDFGVAVLSEFSSADFWLGPGQYDFSALDRAVDNASQQGWRIRASHLIWGAPESLPAWLKNSHYSQDEYIQIMEQYIRDIVGRYKGRVQEWSIANEATIRSWTPGMDFWNDKIGPKYIALAFQTARQADPNGVLIFNDVNNQSSKDTGSDGIVSKMYATVKQLISQGVLIDVVGMQMHLLQPFETSIPPQKADVIATMQKFASLGVRIYITEFDVYMARLPGTQAEKLNTETKIYQDMIEACLESGVCDSFSTWGISMKDPNAASLMFDVNFDPKPAYFAVRDALLNDFSIVPTPTP